MAQAHGKKLLGARLAFKDVVHEWKLSLCMVLAISTSTALSASLSSTR